jgi:hypothetical protein
MSPFGTNRTTCDVRNSVAIEGKADITRAAVSVAIDVVDDARCQHRMCQKGDR